MLDRKLILVVLMVAGAFGVLPAVALADPEIELHEHTSFTVSGEAASLESKEFNVNCTSVTGSGKFENSQAGKVQFAYRECKSSFGVLCTTSGQPTGTITTTELPFRVKSATEGKLAILISSKEGHVSTFKCSFLATVVVSGKGVIGLVSSPGYGEESSTMTIEFSGKEGVQSHTSVDGEETEYSLAESVNGGPTGPASLAGVTKLGFAGQVQPVVVQALGIEIKPAGGRGTVKSNPIGIHCVISCVSVFAQNTKVQLEAVGILFAFNRWETVKGNPGTCVKNTNPCQVTMSGGVILEAFFE